MPNPYFQFRQFTIWHDRCSMKVTTDSCLFGAWVAAEIMDFSQNKSMLDIGAGTGLLSLMVAQQNKCRIDAIEIQQSDYLQALENIAGADFGHQITLHHADVLQFDFQKKYDIIISNPPFYQGDLKGNKSGKNIAHHDEGLTLNELLPLIKGQLSPDGNFYLLLPAKRIEELFKLVQSHQLFLHKIVQVHQTENHAPFRIMVQGSLTTSKLLEEQIVIKVQHQYSDVFRKLLTPYYLNL